MLSLPISAFISALLALVVAWPRASESAETRRALSSLRFIGMAHVAMWWLVIFAPRVLASRTTRELVIIALGTVIAAVGLGMTARFARRAKRGTVWFLPHALFAATYLTDLGRDGIGQIL
jgi:hypothetical protein